MGFCPPLGGRTGSARGRRFGTDLWADAAWADAAWADAAWADVASEDGADGDSSDDDYVLTPEEELVIASDPDLAITE